MMVLLIECDYYRTPIGLYDVPDETVKRISEIEASIGALGQSQLLIPREGDGQSKIEAIDAEVKGLEHEIRVLIQSSPELEYEERTI